MDFKAVFSGFSVNDMAKAKQFYTETLGLEIIGEKMGLELQLPQGSRLFIYEKPDHQPATFTVLNFVVNDIDAAMVSLAEKGVRFERYKLDGAEQDKNGVLRGLATNMGPDIAWFKDPAGNVLSVLQSN
jgi:catechol 2,3-dioxygenase-like lactoylglutathione lyase family enzyme